MVPQAELDKEALLRIFIGKDNLEKLAEISSLEIKPAIKRKMIRDLYNNK